MKAIAKANALNKNDYTDFSAVEAAINAVDRTKNITEQTAVDAMATAIKNAIAGLTRKSSGSSGSSTPRYEVTGTRSDRRRYCVRQPEKRLQGQHCDDHCRTG